MLHATAALLFSLNALMWTHTSAQSTSSASAGQAENPCTLKKDEDGVKAYTCENKDSKFRMVKVLFEADTTAEHLVSMLFDIEGYNNWQYKTINAAVLRHINENELVYYAEFVSPWPFDNRDVVVHMKVERNGENLKVFYNGIPDFIPEKRGITRVASSASSLDVLSLGHGRIKVEYNSNVDPGGNLPPFLMNQFAGEGPFESFSELRRRLNNEGGKVVAEKK